MAAINSPSFAEFHIAIVVAVLALVVFTSAVAVLFLSNICRRCRRKFGDLQPRRNYQPFHSLILGEMKCHPKIKLIGRILQLNKSLNEPS